MRKSAVIALAWFLAAIAGVAVILEAERGSASAPRRPYPRRPRPRAANRRSRRRLGTAAIRRRTSSIAWVAATTGARTARRFSQRGRRRSRRDIELAERAIRSGTKIGRWRPMKTIFSTCRERSTKAWQPPIAAISSLTRRSKSGSHVGRTSKVARGEKPRRTASGVASGSALFHHADVLSISRRYYKPPDGTSVGPRAGRPLSMNSGSVRLRRPFCAAAPSRTAPHSLIAKPPQSLWPQPQPAVPARPCRRGAV